MPTAKPEPILEYNAWDKVVSFFSPRTAMKNAWLRAQASSVLEKGGGSGGGLCGRGDGSGAPLRLVRE